MTLRVMCTATNSIGQMKCGKSYTVEECNKEEVGSNLTNYFCPRCGAFLALDSKDKGRLKAYED